MNEQEIEKIVEIADGDEEFAAAVTALFSGPPDREGEEKFISAQKIAEEYNQVIEFGFLIKSLNGALNSIERSGYVTSTARKNIVRAEGYSRAVMEEQSDELYEEIEEMKEE